MKCPLRYGLNAAIVFLLLILPRFFSIDYYIHMLVMAGIYTILAQSLGLIIGYAGQVSLCHAAFYGIGAYTSALLSLRLGLSFWISIWLAGLSAGAVALMFGSVVLRLKGHFLAITTALFGIFLTLVLNNWTSLTKGPMGLPGIPRPTPILLPGVAIEFSSRADYYYLVVGFVLLTGYMIYRIINSRLGKAMVAIRENEDVAKSVGINPMRFKLIAFCVGSGFAGIAGGFYAHYILFISPISFTLAESINILVMMIFGGMQTFFGPIVGAVILTILPELLRMAGSLRMTIYGCLLILLIIYFPLGTVGTLKKMWFSTTGQSG